MLGFGLAPHSFQSFRFPGCVQIGTKHVPEEGGGD